MELPRDFTGNVARAALREEIRGRFPLRSVHYLSLAVEAESCIGVIESGAPGQIDEAKLAGVVIGSFSFMRWLDDPDAPEIPTVTRMTPGEGIAAMVRLRNWLRGRAASLDGDVAAQITPDGASPESDSPSSEIPPLDVASGQWLKNTTAAAIEGLETETLATYRADGKTSPDKMSGIDKQGRMWRRQGTPNSHPWYLRSTLKSKTTPPKNPG